MLELMASDNSTQAIAHELRVAVRTGEFRRAKMLKKLGFKTPMQLSHFAIRVFDDGKVLAGVSRQDSPHAGGNGHANGNGRRRAK